VTLTKLSREQEFIRLFTNLTQNFKIIPLLFSIFIIPFNKVVFLNFPNFFIGKFNYFQTNNLVISEIFLIFSCLFYLSFKLNKLKIKPKSILPSLFFLWLLLIIPNIHTFLALITTITIFQLDEKDNQLIKKILFITFIIQTLISCLQLIFQSNLGLTELGEPNLNPDTKGIAKLKISNFQILRSYGTLAHPNLLAAYLAILINNLKPSKFSNIMQLGILSTFSLTATISLSITTLIKYLINKTEILKILLIITLSISILIIGIRLQNDNFENITQRVAEIQTQENNLQSTIIKKKSPWEINPIHNVYIFTYQSIGKIGLFLLLANLGQLLYFKNSNSILLSLMFVSDHFWLSLPQGLILLALTLSLFQNNQDFHAKNLKHS